MIRVHWYRGARSGSNFGDQLTRLVLEDLRVAHEWAPPSEADMFGIGSILDSVPPRYQGIVWTTGKIFAEGRPDLRCAEVIALRGRLSLERSLVSSPDDVLLGDGGLVCHRFAPSVLKRFELGIVPHYVDAGDPVVAAIAATSDVITVIDVLRPPLEVIAAIAECHRILSSSLHGLVIADSLRIPNCWITLGRGDRPVAGGGFKFRDYYSVFGFETVEPLHLHPDDTLDTIVLELAGYSRPGIDAVLDGMETAREILRRSRPNAGRAQTRHDVTVATHEEQRD